MLFYVITEDHAKGLSTFTVMAGLGGFMGYALGGINWDDTSLGRYAFYMWDIINNMRRIIG